MIKFLSYRALLLAGFILFIFLDSASAQTANPIFTPAEKIELQNIIKKYLRKNPGVIVKSIEDFTEHWRRDQQNQARLTLALLEKQVLNDGTHRLREIPMEMLQLSSFLTIFAPTANASFPSYKNFLNKTKTCDMSLRSFPYYRRTLA